MGYRSEVAAMFYVRNSMDNTDEQIAKATALFDLWWQANMDGCSEWSSEDFEQSKGCRKLHCHDVKWYDSYPEVQWFNEFSKKFMEELCDNSELDGGSGLNKCFAYEFARMGEELVDNEYVRSDDADWRLSISRSINVD